MIEIIEIIDARGPHDREIIEAASHSDRANLTFNLSWQGCRARWNLSDTTFLHPDDVATVYGDSTVDASIICTPTFTHEGFITGSLE